MGRKDLPFGGKTVVFGGDFRQVLPVVRKGSRAQIVGASLRKSYLWEFMRHLKLVRNMRAQTDPWFADYMLRIGNGTEEIMKMVMYAFLTKYVSVHWGFRERS
jgi:ATP-dependent DNA helicase PIF1